MLVLSRKKGESIMIGDQIELVVLGLDGDAVRIGIQAPKQIQVFRKEVYEAIRQSNKEASNSSIELGQLARIIRKEE